MSGEVTRGDIDELRKSLSDLTTVVDGLSRSIRKFVATSENGESNQLRCSLESSSLASSFKEDVFDPDHSSTPGKRLNFDQSPDKKNRCRERQLKRLEPNSFKWSRKGTRHTRGKRLKQRFGKDYAFYRMDIPVFNGQMNIDQILDWLSETERFFKCMKVPEFRRVKMVVNKLKGTALEWWNQMDMLRRREHKCPIRSWVKMKAIIRQRFLPADFKKILLSQYKNCKQGTRTVDDYTMEFHQLSARFEICESNDQFIARYVRGLKKEIQENIHLHTLLTLTDAIDVATYIESEHQIF